jgi:hypothetical protein
MNCLKYSLAVTSLLLAFSSQAATITQFGTDVSYTYDDSTAYGTGVVLGNAIFFTPSAFLAESLDGAGLATTTATLNIDVSATTSGFSMASFSLFEDGDYRLKGSGASVAADGFFRATSLSTTCGAPPCQTTALFDAGTLSDTGGSLALWNMGDSLNLASVAGWGSDTDVKLTIQNNLTAETLASGEIAFIQKKFSVTIPQVPVPAAVWLFGSGLIGLAGLARRKTS